MTESKGHVEFRKTGERKFYAPDRDLLHIYPTLIKSTLSEVCEAVPEEVFNTQFKPFVKELATIYNKAVTTDKPADIIISETSKELIKYKKVLPEFLFTFFTMIIAVYINAVRDAAEIPVLTDRELESALRSTSILAKLPKDVRDMVEPYIKLATSNSTAFGEDNGTFSEITESS